MSAFTIYQSPQDIAKKLFREAGRMLSGKSREDVADHLLNFSVTHTALRDWTFAATNKNKSDNATMTAWRARANGLFGDFADIANSGKHLRLKEQQAITKESQMQVVAMSGDDIHPELTRNQKTFLIIRPDETEFDLWKAFFLINKEWEQIFHDELNTTLPNSAESIVETIFRF